MVRLPYSVEAWTLGSFPDVLRGELEDLSPDVLPLQQGLTTGSYAVGDSFRVMVMGATEDSATVKATVGIFYEGITAGCSCADDPTPVEPVPEYCEVLVTIDKRTAQAAFTLVDGLD